MNPILATNSTGITALTLPGSAVLSGSGTGFAAALASAQAASSAIDGTEVTEPVSGSWATGIEKAASASGVPLPTAAGQPPKKQSSSALAGGAANASLGAGMNLAFAVPLPVPLPLPEPALSFVPAPSSGTTTQAVSSLGTMQSESLLARASDSAAVATIPAATATAPTFAVAARQSTASFGARGIFHQNDGAPFAAGDNETAIAQGAPNIISANVIPANLVVPGTVVPGLPASVDSQSLNSPTAAPTTAVEGIPSSGVAAMLPAANLSSSKIISLSNASPGAASLGIVEHGFASRVQSTVGRESLAKSAAPGTAKIQNSNAAAVPQPETPARTSGAAFAESAVNLSGDLAARNGGLTNGLSSNQSAAAAGAPAARSSIRPSGETQEEAQENDTITTAGNTVVPGQSAPVLLASAWLDAEPAAGTPFASAANAPVTTGDASVIPPVNISIGAQDGLAAETTSASGNAAGESAGNSASNSTGFNSPPIVSVPSAFFSARMAFPAASAKTAPNEVSAIAPAAGKSATAAPPTSATLSVATSNSVSDNETALSGQTPFSVFFSSPGPGAESAASTLPKMILPAAAPAMRNGQTTPTTASGVNAQVSRAPGSSGQSAPVQAGATPTPAGASATPAPRHATDSDASTLPVASAQAAPPSMAAPPPTGTAVSIASQAAASQPNGGDALPKAPATPAAALDVQARAMAAPGEQIAAGQAVVPGPVQMAQMVTRAEASEMRIGMTTSAFGSVEVRTMVHANDVGLVIGSEKGDLRSLLANDIPAITNTLQQQNLRLNSVNFMQGFAFSNNASGGGNSQPQGFVPARPSTHPGLPDTAAEDSRESFAETDYSSDSGSLSILA